MTMKNRIVTAAAFMAAATLFGEPALATSTGITALNAAATGATTLVTGLAGIAALIFIGLAIWEFLAHKQLVRAIVELVCGVVIGVIAANAGSVVSTFGLGGAQL